MPTVAKLTTPTSLNLSFANIFVMSELSCLTFPLPAQREQGVRGDACTVTSACLYAGAKQLSAPCLSIRVSCSVGLLTWEAFWGPVACSERGIAVARGVTELRDARAGGQAWILRRWEKYCRWSDTKRP
jgi:hypothetical protein